MARILVTGASGFIGRHLAVALHAQGHAVRANGRNAARLAELPVAIERRPQDLLHADLHALLHGCDIVVHSAALSSPWGKPADFHAANVTVTERLLQAAQHAGVQRFVQWKSQPLASHLNYGAVWAQ